jgi:hypothetical protein
MIYKFNKTSLKFESIFFKASGFIVCAIVFAAISSYIYGHHKGYVDHANGATSPEERMIIIRENDKFSEEKFKEYLLQLNIRFPHIVYAQAVLETGNFASKIFKSNNNLFGMKEAKVRATTNLGTDLGHAMYGHWRESVVDYALFQCAFLTKIKTEEGYYEYLKENYAESPNYVSKVKELAKDFKRGI